MVRLGPAATARIRRGELLSRLVSDVDARQDLLIRVLIPTAAAAAVGLLTAVGVGLLLPAGGLVIAAGLVVAGILAPAATAWAARRTERCTAAARGDVLSRTVEIIDGAADLLVCGAAAAYRQRLDAADSRRARCCAARLWPADWAAASPYWPSARPPSLAPPSGSPRSATARCPDRRWPCSALTPLALADVVAGLPDAAVRLLTAVPAAHRLAELATTQAPVTEPASSPPATAPTGFAARDLAVRWPGADRDAVRDVDLDLIPRLPAGAGRALGLGEVHGGRSAVAHAQPARGHTSRRRP